MIKTIQSFIKVVVVLMMKSFGITAQTMAVTNMMKKSLLIQDTQQTLLGQMVKLVEHKVTGITV